MEGDLRVHKFYLDYEGEKTHALAFLPAPDKAPAKALGVFTHGYSSHKGSILNWAVRLAEEGMPSVIYDLPGHYLGNYSKVKDFEVFKTESPNLFAASHKILAELSGQEPSNVVLGGHSLGAILALMASKTSYFASLETTMVCVGLGLLPVGAKHLFKSPFYKSTLNIRSQLVSEELHPDKMFPWINVAKEKISLNGQKIHFITGADDMVVGEGGTQRMVTNLSPNNEVTMNIPEKLPHHLPEMAAGHIKKFLKMENLL